MKITKHSSGAKKHDEGKLRLDLITPEMIEALALPLTYGAKKYDDHNWRKGLKHSVHYAAAMRHLMKFWDGIDLDEESNIEHLAHAMVNLGMIYTNFARGRDELDDRYRGE